MLRSKMLPLLAVLAGLFIAACGGDDDDGGGSADVGDYASDICTAFTDWTQAIQDRQTELQEGLQPGASPQEGKDALQGFLDDAVAASDQLVEDVDAAGTPDTENGEDAADALQSTPRRARATSSPRPRRTSPTCRRTARRRSGRPPTSSATK